MENCTWTSQMFLRLVFVGLFVLCKGQEDNPIAPMMKEEQEALYSAIQGFVGQSWNGSDLYPDPCGWTPIQGVACDLYDGFWYVTALKIGPSSDNSLMCTGKAEFSRHLFMLKYLRVLSFFNCFISPSQNPVKIPSSNWEKYTNSLETLEFRSNPGLIGAIPNTIGYLKKLQSLVMLENGLTGGLPAEIGNLLELRQLVLSGNQFVGQIPASVGGLVGLLILDLSRNNLSGPFPLTLGNLSSLLKLDLSDNMFEGELPTEIGNLRNLTLLDLSGNKFSGGLVQSLQEMISLKETVISNNPIRGDLVGIQWQKLQDLELLDLSNTGLTGNIPESITEMKRLRFLGLNNNSLSGSLSPRLAYLPSITSFYVYGNNLTGKLEFPEWFYRKMGKRFGAWDNLNLCHQTSNFLKGVKPCQQETSTTDWVPNAKVSEVSRNQNSLLATSLAGSSTGFHTFWWASISYGVLMLL